MRCESLTGFLTQLRCDADAAVKCVPCRRNICKGHSRPSSVGMLCISCFQKRVEPARSISIDDLSKEDYDPYLYAAYFYKTYDYEPFVLEEPKPSEDAEAVG